MFLCRIYYRDHIKNCSIPNDHKAILVHSIEPEFSGDNIAELLFIVDALSNVGFSSVWIFISYFGYARQDKPTYPYMSSSGQVIMNSLYNNPFVERIITVDLHSNRLFNKKVHNILPYSSFINNMIKHYHVLDNFVVVAPDEGSISRARSFAQLAHLGNPAIMQKHRSAPGISEIVHFSDENIKEKKSIIVDDIIDGGGTICNAAQILLEHSSSGVVACITHGVLSRGSIEKIDNSSIEKLFLGDTIDNSHKLSGAKKIEQVPIIKDIIEELMKIMNLNN